MDDAAPSWVLVEQLASRDLGQRMRAVAALRLMERDAAPALERGLAGHARPEVRRWCAYLLLRAHRPESASAICAATVDPVAAVRLLAVQALAGDLDAAHGLEVDPIPLLVRLARQDRSKRVRCAALQQLLRCPQDPRARAAIAECGFAGDGQAPPRRSAWLLPPGDRPAVATQR